MATKRDPRRQAVMCYTDIDVLMKVKTVIKGRKVAIKSPKNVRQTKGVRDMGFADFFIETVAERVKDVKPSREAKAWGRAILEAKLSERRDLDSVHDEDETQRQTRMRMKLYFKNKLSQAEKILESLKAAKGKTPELSEQIRKEESRVRELREYFQKYDQACEGYVDRRKKKQT